MPNWLLCNIKDNLHKETKAFELWQAIDIQIGNISPELGEMVYRNRENGVQN